MLISLIRPYTGKYILGLLESISGPPLSLPMQEVLNKAAVIQAREEGKGKGYGKKGPKTEQLEEIMGRPRSSTKSVPCPPNDRRPNTHSPTNNRHPNTESTNTRSTNARSPNRSNTRSTNIRSPNTRSTNIRSPNTRSQLTASNGNEDGDGDESNVKSDSNRDLTSEPTSESDSDVESRLPKKEKEAKSA